MTIKEMNAHLEECQYDRVDFGNPEYIMPGPVAVLKLKVDHASYENREEALADPNDGAFRINREEGLMFFSQEDLPGTKMKVMEVSLAFGPADPEQVVEDALEDRDTTVECWDAIIAVPRDMSDEDIATELRTAVFERIHGHQLNQEMREEAIDEYCEALGLDQDVDGRFVDAQAPDLDHVREALSGAREREDQDRTL